jgi:hypothetical protein
LTAYVLVLGVVTIVAIQMAGAILYVTTTLPPVALLKVFARYLKRGEEEAAVEYFSPFETMTRLIRIKRRVYCLIVGILLAGIAASIACAVYRPGALAFVIPGFLVASLNLLIAVGVLYIWIRQLRKMPELED